MGRRKDGQKDKKNKKGGGKKRKKNSDEVAQLWAKELRALKKRANFIAGRISKSGIPAKCFVGWQDGYLCLSCTAQRRRCHIEISFVGEPSLLEERLDDFSNFCKLG